MFETLFSRPCAIQRHRSGFLATERTAYLAQLAAQGTPPTTLRIRAHYCLHVARELKNWPLNYQFTPAEIDTMATAWAAQSVASGRASTPKNPQRMFRMTAVAFLRFSDRFHLTPTAAPGRYADRIEAFIKEQRQYRWQSEETCRVGRGQVVAFLSYLEEQGYDLERIDVGHVDVYFQHITHRLSRMTLRNVAKASVVAMMAGADFIKTSTGKETVNATFPVGLVMARAIRGYAEETGMAVGFKPAGGIRTAKQSLEWLALMKEELGDAWLAPHLFRLGASSGMLADIERQLEFHVTGRYSAEHRHPIA